MNLKHFILGQNCFMVQQHLFGVDTETSPQFGSPYIWTANGTEYHLWPEAGIPHGNRFKVLFSTDDSLHKIPPMVLEDHNSKNTYFEICDKLGNLVDVIDSNAYLLAMQISSPYLDDIQTYTEKTKQAFCDFRNKPKEAGYQYGKQEMAGFSEWQYNTNTIVRANGDHSLWIYKERRYTFEEVFEIYTKDKQAGQILAIESFDVEMEETTFAGRHPNSGEQGIWPTGELEPATNQLGQVVALNVKYK